MKNGVSAVAKTPFFIVRNAILLLHPLHIGASGRINFN